MNGPQHPSRRAWGRRVGGPRWFALTVLSLSCGLLAGCAGHGSATPTDADFQALLARSFRSEGPATLDRLVPDADQAACSTGQPPDATTAARIEAQARASVRPPADGRYLGDWREGEKIAQSGRGHSWTDLPGSPAGGGCYNCHQLSPAELSHGTLGPSLLGYGRLRGVTDPASPQAQAVVQATWVQLYNAWGHHACAAMPRFGHQGLLTDVQRQHLMALLLDPASPVNALPPAAEQPR